MITIQGFTKFIGNTAFQIAAAIGVSRLNGDEIVLVPKTWEYKKYFKHEFKEYAGEKIQYIHKDPGFHFTQIHYQPDMAIDGYFQSHKYFEHCEQKICEMFEVTDAVKDLCRNTINSMNRFRSDGNLIVAIHVRRGDYLRLPKHHPVLTMDYYNTAIDIVKLKTRAPCKFFVFSDDPQWCKDNFVGNDFVIMSGNIDIQDLFLMSLCDHFIIANSSFSWWGHWLSKNVDKICIAPKKWFGSAYADWDTSDLYMRNMIVL